MRLSYASSSSSASTSSSSSASTDSESDVGDVSYLATKKPPRPALKPATSKPLAGHAPVASTSSPRVTFASSTNLGVSSSRRPSSHRETLSTSTSSSEEDEDELIHSPRRQSSYRPESHKKALAYWASLDPPVWKSSSLVHMKSSLQNLSSPHRQPSSAHQAAQSKARVAARQAELEEINALLADLKVSRAEETAALHANFEERNRSLWDTIEGAIAAKEAEARAAQQREAEVLAQAREREEAAKKAAKEAQDQALKEEADRAAKEKEDARLKAEAEAKQAQNNVGKRMWTERHALIQRLKEVNPTVVNNPDWRKACREAKKIITPKVGQVTNSRSHIQNIAQQISAALASVQSNELPYLWALNHFAKALIQQAETELTARLSAAFPLARLTHHIFAAHPQLGPVLMARLSKKCFYLASFLPPRSAYPNDQAYAKALGVNSGEGLMASAARLRGIVALFSCIVALADQSPSTTPRDFRPDAAWTFLAGLTRPELGVNGRQDAAPGLFDTAFELLGFKMSIYGTQWEKLWRAVRAQLASWPVSEGWVKASVKRLELRLEEWETKGIPVPEGYQPES